MNTDLSHFSEWALALLPRLFLYPGALFALAAWVMLRLAVDGVTGINPRTLILSMTRLNLPAALAWVAVALLPLPAAAPLSFPAGTFVIAGLLLTSLVTGWSGLTGEREYVPAAALSANIALAAAVIAPAAAGSTLLRPTVEGTGGQITQWLALAAGMAGLCVLAPGAAREFSSGLRWLAWLGLLAYPLFGQGFIPALLALCLAYLAGIAIAGFYARMRALSPSEVAGADRAAASICWGLAALALLLAVG